MPELFPESEVTQLSPRLAWMKRHDVVTGKNEAGKWFAIITEDLVGSGESEVAALEDLVVRSGLKHWLL